MKKIASVLTTVGLAGTLIVGGVAPAQAAPGDVTCKVVSSKYVAPGVVQKREVCKKQYGSIASLTTFTISDRTYLKVLKGYRM